MLKNYLNNIIDNRISKYLPNIIGESIPHTVNSNNPIDATEWIIKKVKKNERVPVGNFFTSEPIVLEHKVLKMTGNGFLFYDVDDYRIGIKHNDYVTAIMPMSNFNVIEIKGKYAGVENGLIYAGYVENFDKAGVYFDANERLQFNTIRGLFVDDSWYNVTKTGKGIKAIDFETDIRHDLKSEYAGYIDLINLNVKYCNKGVNLPMRSEIAKQDGLSINSISIINPKMWGCKQFLNLEWGSNMLLWNGNLHDFPVLNEEEMGMYAINAEISKSELHYQIYDMTSSSRDRKGFYRHDNKEIQISDENRKTTLINNRFRNRY